jgi:hypothetical protein
VIFEQDLSDPSEQKMSDPSTKHPTLEVGVYDSHELLQAVLRWAPHPISDLVHKARH